MPPAVDAPSGDALPPAVDLADLCIMTDSVGDLILGRVSLIGLWRLRLVSHGVREAIKAFLVHLPRPCVFGGRHCSGGESVVYTDAEMLDLSTMRWQRAWLPALPGPLCAAGACTDGAGGVIIVGGKAAPDAEASMCSWRCDPSIGAWTPLPALRSPRVQPALLKLADGRVLVAGGGTAEVEALAMEAESHDGRDGARWDELPELRCKPTCSQRRTGTVGGVLLDGRAVLASGCRDTVSTSEEGWEGCRPGDDEVLCSSVYDPANGSWGVAPRLWTPRWDAAGCVLPSGRLAVVGGIFSRSREQNGFREVDSTVYQVVDTYVASVEAFDPEINRAMQVAEADTASTSPRMAQHRWRASELAPSERWTTLPDMSCGPRAGLCAVPVAGGMLVMGGRDTDETLRTAELFDEESATWVELPHPMLRARDLAAATTVSPTVWRQWEDNRG